MFRPHYLRKSQLRRRAVQRPQHSHVPDDARFVYDQEENLEEFQVFLELREKKTLPGTG